MFRTLDRISGGAGQRLPEWASTHPDPDNRVKRTEQRADSVQQSGRSLSGATRARESYMKLLDGFVFGADPRQGYFKNGVFYHPDLKFQLTFPAGWPTQNKPEGVLAAVAPDGRAGCSCAWGRARRRPPPPTRSSPSRACTAAGHQQRAGQRTAGELGRLQGRSSRTARR